MNGARHNPHLIKVALMSDYDFRSLNDKEFEIFCSDLIGDSHGQRFERFKPGKDGGVDGRYFSSDGDEVILQCKHQPGTSLAQLIKKLGSDEKIKLDRLRPKRYLLAISHTLTRHNKKQISDQLAPYISLESDILGAEDLNDLLRARPEIERRHYKLWLQSTAVLEQIYNNAILGRSSHSLEEIVASSSRYVVTVNHEAALQILDRLGVVIIAGEPGVGKTTLADHLCLHYVARGFSYIRVADDIREAESLFDPDSKQVFYFDDFLGRNYLEALGGHEGNQITMFMRRVSSNKNKRFVLTSRSIILNQGKFLIDNFDHGNTQKNEYELRIKSLKDIDKAQILYNHIWHSNLDDSYIEELYLNRRYRDVIGHKNFNPRLISYITDATRLETCPSENYWELISKSLSNPSQIWDNPFNAQQDDYGRALIILMALNGAALDEKILSEAYHRFLLLPESGGFIGRREFQANIRLLTGSFFNRTIMREGRVVIDLFNPSIGDYILKRYAGDVLTLRLGLQSLRTLRSIITLRSLRADKYLSSEGACKVCEELIGNLVFEKFSNSSLEYVAALCDIYRDCLGEVGEPIDAFRAAMLFVLNNTHETVDYAFEVIEWGLEKSIIDCGQALNYIENCVNTISTYAQMQAVQSLLNVIHESTPSYHEVCQAVKKSSIDLIVDNFSEFIDLNEAFSKVQDGSNRDAEEFVIQIIERELDNIGIEFSVEDVDQIIENVDVSYEFERYLANSYEDYEHQYDGPLRIAIDEIDDLFDRGL